MTIRTAHSQHASIDAAVGDLRNQLEGTRPHLLMFYASSHYDPHQLSAAIQAAFPGAGTFGCTTAGEIVTGQMLSNSLVAMAFPQDAIPEYAIQVVENLKDGPRIDHAFKAFEQKFGAPMRQLDFTKHLGFVLTDGLSGAEEKVNDVIGNLTDVPFIGGSAGDDLKFQATYVFANGKAYSDASVLALVKPAKPFHFLKTQSFKTLDQSLVATKVVEQSREVLEFNEQPAAVAYAKAIQQPVEAASEYFMRHPVGLMVGDEPFVRSPQQVKGETMVFYCNIKEGMELSVLESTDIVADTRRELEAKIQEIGGISALVNFHCILRTLELQSKGLMGAYGEVFAGVPTVGFSTYGESYLGHINQTSTMVAFE